MKKLTVIFAAVILATGLSSCDDLVLEEPTVIVTKDMQTIDMVATHAIDTEVSVAQLTFVPNSVAPWLGRVILLDDAGHLYSTDIEGRAPKPVGSGTYIDIFGLAREKAAGVFLAITKDNKIEAFIESDDYGNFSPMIYSGEDIKVQAFCPNKLSQDSRVNTVTASGKYKTLSLAVEGKKIGHEVSDTNSSFESASKCLTNYTTIKYDLIDFQATAGKHNGLYISEPTSNDPLAKRRQLNANITNGLSVRGLDHVKFVASTQSNYGGGAYADGILALVDKDANRIVFISLSYAERQLMKALNPPEDVQ